MANRYIDTGFYKSPFVRSLKGSLKGLYSFIICDCSGAGIWTVDLDIASVYVGFLISEKEAQEAFIKTGKAIDLKNGKWFIPDFLEHQYPSGLQENNRAHTNFILELKKYSLIDENLKPIWRGIEGAYIAPNVMVKVMEEVKVTKGGAGGAIKLIPAEVVLPWDSKSFQDAWGTWKEYKLQQHKFKYKGTISEQAALKDLAELSRGDEETAIELIYHAVSKSWKGIYHKTKVKDYNKPAPNSMAALQAVQDDPVYQAAMARVVKGEAPFGNP